MSVCKSVVSDSRKGQALRWESQDLDQGNKNPNESCPFSNEESKSRISGSSPSYKGGSCWH